MALETKYTCDECGQLIDGTNAPGMRKIEIFAGVLVTLVAQERVNPMMGEDRHYHRCCFEAVLKRIDAKQSPR